MNWLEMVENKRKWKEEEGRKRGRARKEGRREEREYVFLSFYGGGGPPHDVFANRKLRDNRVKKKKENRTSPNIPNQNTFYFKPFFKNSFQNFK